jgi:hypothetical protein
MDQPSFSAGRSLILGTDLFTLFLENLPINDLFFLENAPK